MNKSEAGLYKIENGFLRVLSFEEDRALVIRSDSMALPGWEERSVVEDLEPCGNDELGASDYAELDADQRRIAHERFTLIVPVLPYIGDIKARKRAIREIADRAGVSQQTIKKYICNYMLSNDVSSLAPKKRSFTRELTSTEKNMRWALNRWYYSWKKLPLSTAYANMLKEKYCDADGKLLPDYPSIYQFRYFHKKTNSLRKTVISREGIKAYQRDYRPLLGDGVQEYCPIVGYGMLDATTCDIYLVNDAGQVVGRPIFVANVDAFSGLCCGYSLLWEGGVYSLRNLLLNTITDKREWCKRFGIDISDEDWPCKQLPAVLMTDLGSEFTSGTFEQITELGVTLINLDAYRPDLKGPVEKLFDLIQTSYREHLKGKGVIEPDFQERGAHDYRKDACLTMEDFEKVILRCIIHYNSEQVLDNYPYSKAMLDAKVRPYSSDIWMWAVKAGISNLIQTEGRQLLLTLLPRTRGVFSRYGLRVNKMRYHCEGFTDRYLAGGNVTVAFNPDDVSKVWLFENGQYTEFLLIESRYQDKSLDEVVAIQKERNQLIRSETQEALQAKIDLARHIEAIAAGKEPEPGAGIKDIRSARSKARRDRHNNMKDLFAEA